MLEAGLTDVAQAFGADRATLWQRIGDTAVFAKSHRWAADSTMPTLPQANVNLPWVNSRLVLGEVVRFACRGELPAQAHSDLQSLEALGIGAAVIVPLEVAGHVVGVLSIATTREPVDWPDELVPRAQLLGQAFAAFIGRQQADLLQHWRSLTPREAEVFELVVQGLLNKQVADRLGIGERTVKIHRGRVVAKMGAASVADLVRMAERIALHAGLAPIRPSVSGPVEVHGAARRRGHVDRCVD